MASDLIPDSYESTADPNPTSDSLDASNDMTTPDTALWIAEEFDSIWMISRFLDSGGSLSFGRATSRIFRSAKWPNVEFCTDEMRMEHGCAGYSVMGRNAMAWNPAAS